MTGFNASILQNPLSDQFWGPVTATLDWCEVNYQFSRYVAEWANTFSNLFTIVLAYYGGLLVSAANLPPRYIAGWLGFALVGLGSFVYHATLQYSAQLADELPMVYVGSYCAAVLSDTQPGHDIWNMRSLGIITIFAVFNIGFTFAYAIHRNPVFHQVVFAAIMFFNVFRTWYILANSSPSPSSPAIYRIPLQDRRTVASLFGTGAFIFAFGFFVWNLDNIFCSTVTPWKHQIGWPIAFLLEGHSWWHILTATGTYLMLVGNTYLTLGVKDDFSHYGVSYKWGLLPAIERVPRQEAVKNKYQ